MQSTEELDFSTKAGASILALRIADQYGTSFEKW